MRFVDEFRDGTLAAGLAAAIAREAHPQREYRFMEFCGGHTHAISRHGVVDLLPPNLRMIHGPGCPVCVLPVGRIDQAIGLALERDVTLCTYADTLRVPASRGRSLLAARSQGADVRIVYSCADALRIARENPQREVVFFAIGFETTTPPTAVAIQQAAAQRLANFSVLCCHVLTPPAIQAIVDGAGSGPGSDPGGDPGGGPGGGPGTGTSTGTSTSTSAASGAGTGNGNGEARRVRIDGFVGPAHVSTVIGSRPYERFARDAGKPVVIAGFEPLDVMQAILMLVRQVNEGRHEVENEFTRAVTRDGNRAAQRRVAEVFEERESFEWRGLGALPRSALRIRDAYRAWDAEQRFGLTYRGVPDHKSCDCGAILRGAKRPVDCKLFGTVCTPATPMGSCMVSSEGACAAHYTFGRFRDAATPA